MRGSIVLLVGFAAAAQELGLEVILGTFIAGALLKLADRDEAMTHPDFHPKLAAIGFGVFIPVFFVTSGVRFDLDALFADADTLIMVPIFLAALLLVRGLPALLYRGYLPRRQIRVAALFQATSLPVHRRRDGDRHGARSRRPGRERRADRGRPALGDGVPADRGDTSETTRQRRDMSDTTC